VGPSLPVGDDGDRKFREDLLDGLSLTPAGKNKFSTMESKKLRVRSDQRFRNRTGYITADRTPAITPAVAPTAQEFVIHCATNMTKVVPPTTQAMNAMIRNGAFGRGGMDTTRRDRLVRGESRIGSG